MNERDRVHHGQPLFRDVRGSSIAEVPVECVAKIDCPPLRDHSACDVWPTHRAPRRLFEHGRQLYSHTKLVQSLNDSRRASAAHVAKSGELALHLVSIAEMESENVRFAVAFDRAQLNTGNDPNAELRADRGRLSDAIDRVVIRQSERRESNPFRLADDVARWAGSVRRGRVRVEVDESLGGLSIRLKIAHAE